MRLFVQVFSFSGISCLFIFVCALGCGGGGGGGGGGKSKPQTSFYLGGGKFGVWERRLLPPLNSTPLYFSYFALSFCLYFHLSFRFFMFFFFLMLFFFFCFFFLSARPPNISLLFIWSPAANLVLCSLSGDPFVDLWPAEGLGGETTPPSLPPLLPLSLTSPLPPLRST